MQVAIPILLDFQKEPGAQKTRGCGSRSASLVKHETVAWAAAQDCVQVLSSGSRLRIRV